MKIVASKLQISGCLMFSNKISEVNTDISINYISLECLKSRKLGLFFYILMRVQGLYQKTVLKLECVQSVTGQISWTP